MRITSAGNVCIANTLTIGTACAAFGRPLTVFSDIVAYFSSQESITMGISAGTGAQSWGIQVCDTGDGGSALHLNARGGNVGINKGADNSASYPLDVNGTIAGKDLVRITPTSTVSVSTSATTISTTTNDYGAIAIVWGADTGGNIFTDLLFYSLSAATVMQSQSPSGSPAGRTYSMSSGNLQLAMSSGTYTVRYQAIFAQ